MLLNINTFSRLGIGRLSEFQPRPDTIDTRPIGVDLALETDRPGNEATVY